MMEKHLLEIVDIKDENTRTKTYYLKRPSEIDWIEGSFMHITFDGVEPSPETVRHMSILTLPEEDTIAFTTRIDHDTDFKQKLSKLTVDDHLVMFKIHSHLGLRRIDKPLVFLSMGVGVATLRPLFKAYQKNKEGIPSITHLSIDTDQPYLFENEIKGEQVQHLYVNNRQDYYNRLKETVNPDALYYVVGSDQFMKDSIKALKEEGIQSDQILIDRRETTRFMYHLDDSLVF